MDLSVSKKSSFDIITKLLNRAPKQYQKKNYSGLALKQFEKLLPLTIPDKIKEDIAHYFDYLRNNRSTNSLKKWEKATGCSDSPSSYKVENYRPIFSFLYYDKITEGFFLPLLLSKLEPAFENNVHKMSIDEFNRQCRLSIIHFKPDIDNIDLKILQVLSQNPSLVVKELTEKIDHSYVTIYQHLQKLKAKLGLRVLTRINWAKLGITGIFIITNCREDFIDFSEFKEFLDGQATYLWGKAHYLRYYIVNKEIGKKMVQCYKTTKKTTKSNLELYELVDGPLVGWGFDSYTSEEQRWDFDFVSAFKQISAVEKSKQNNQDFFSNNLNSIEPYKLTPLEIKIIDTLVGKFDLTQKELAVELGMHAQNLSTIKLKLLKDKVIYPRLEIRNFLPLYCILWCSSKNQDIIEIIISLLQRMPFSNISPVRSHNNLDKTQLICFLYLDDILYSNLVVFLMELFEKQQIDDFRLGLNIESYFGMGQAANILGK